MISMFFSKQKLSLYLLIASLFFLCSFEKKTSHPYPHPVWKYRFGGPRQHNGKMWTSYKTNPTKNAQATDEPTEGTVTLLSNPFVGDGGSVCIGYNYTFWTPFPTAPTHWYFFNCYLAQDLGNNTMRVIFNNGLHTEGWAAIDIEVQDSNGNWFFYEMSVTEDTGCDKPDPQITHRVVSESPVQQAKLR